LSGWGVIVLKLKNYVGKYLFRAIKSLSLLGVIPYWNNNCCIALMKPQVMVIKYLELKFWKNFFAYYQL
jgi:hypothetical protein